MIEAVLFDLDGTLADTAPDLCAALNLLLAEQGKPALALALARPYASSGMRGMLDAGFGMVPGDPDYIAFAQRLLKHYERALCQTTLLFPGIAELLVELDRRDIRWGIVTNKAQRYTLPLIEALGLRQRCACIVSGDSSPRLKPHPAPLLLACIAAQALPTRSLYVGDDLRDIQAGRAAGVGTVAAAYGYLGVAVPLASWQADAIVAQPMEILGLLESP